VEVNRAEAKRAGELPQAAIIGGQELERDIGTLTSTMNGIGNSISCP
jgi:hypothetical protein